MPNAASQIWPNLRSDDQSSKQQQQRAQPNTLADALYPSLSPRQKAWDEFRERDRQSLLKGLRELNARLGRRS